MSKRPGFRVQWKVGTKGRLGIFECGRQIVWHHATAKQPQNGNQIVTPRRPFLDNTTSNARIPRPLYEVCRGLGKVVRGVR